MTRSKCTLRKAHRLSVAPMLYRTNRDFRYFLRLISKHCLLYTEMVTTGSLIHGNRDRFMNHDISEYLLALQLGGSSPEDLAKCARYGQDAGYNEINLNVGCPSDRALSGGFGACLMVRLDLIVECISAMRAEIDIPVTVKTRLGIDSMDSYEFITEFIGRVSEAGSDAFILHARKAWLQGLSPKENRDIPPLNYQRVYQIKRNFPHLHIDINGGIHALSEVQLHLNQVDGVMIGRAICHSPYLLAEADNLLFADDHSIPTRHQIIEQMLPYVEQRMTEGCSLKSITSHLLGMFQGQIGARRWRRYLSEKSHLERAGPEVLQKALALVPESGTTVK